MGAIGAEELMNWETLQGSSYGKEEKILVLVRLRPLSDKEIARAEVVDWECINSTTILYRNSLQERSGLPTAYSFDRVYRGDCTTREVYEEGTKDIALSVVGATIFAYGQTSSGKTYTMNGVTEYAVADIYDYIKRHEERAFVLKFSAIEIYNEVVRDLLSTDNTPLRLLDDPERGTIIEKLTEETLRDQNHLRELISICEAQRQVGETSLNETSSRSHQILRLTIESSAREFLGKDKSTTLAASVNFVDLAGSERASQALSAGQRLKEGCHINRSLLTLGTVIRKLSKGRSGHVNYRDSKLTRILQPALGGNARTAIICTLSPSRSHVEQSRNTLLFACCAKEVSTNAQVNVVMSDKALVKQLQKEVARLESELKTPGPTCDHAALLRKKDAHIEKLEKEVRELKKQLDLAHSQIDDLTSTAESGKNSQKQSGPRSANGTSDLLFSEDSEDHYSPDDSTHDPNQDIDETLIRFEEDCDDICKEVRCIDESSHERTRESFGISSSSLDDEETTQTSTVLVNSHNVENESLSALTSQVSGISKCNGSFILTRSQSCRANLMRRSPDFEMAEQSESTPPEQSESTPPSVVEKSFVRKQWKIPPVIYGAVGVKLTRNDSQCSDCSSYVDGMQSQNCSDWDDDIPTLGSFVAGLREMAKLQCENQDGNQAQENGKRDENNARDIALDPINDWPLKFEKLQKSIFELWQACSVSLVHRTYFTLLIKDDFTDSIYMEVEHRRLSYLRDTFSRGNSSVQDGHNLTLASSKKALRREREMLSRFMYKRYTEDEINKIYQEWGISLNSKKRRLQLVRLLWSDAENVDHVTKSAAIVAKLIGFSEHGQALNEMFGLSFAHPRMSRRSFGWKNSMSSLL
ncbi:kinesin-like protein nack1 [Phtheirospermum japonicum]|uniref:Kinesin-like protein n=1 Tax=Phtheirospermum japonicum TaxID=374723 RepID=A0A830BKJ1_9LAMI|nr:kinesin-like protein nack1 [Phtheirospermum japonicum]